MGGGGMGYLGAVYNGYLDRYRLWSTAGLKDIQAEWARMSPVRRFFAHFSLITNYESRNRAIADIIEARANPVGETAQRINWKLDAYAEDSGRASVTA